MVIFAKGGSNYEIIKKIRKEYSHIRSLLRNESVRGLLSSNPSLKYKTYMYCKNMQLLSMPEARRLLLAHFIELAPYDTSQTINVLIFFIFRPGALMLLSVFMLCFTYLPLCFGRVMIE